MLYYVLIVGKNNMVIHNKTQTLEYNKDKGTISLCIYSDDGF